MKLVVKMIYDIDSYLMLRGYENVVDAPLEEFVNMLRLYLLEALWELDYANHDENDRNLDTITLFTKYSQKINNKFELNSIISYLLGYISTLQESGVLWHVSKDGQTNLSWNKKTYDIIEELLTPKEVNYPLTFALVLNTALYLRSTKEKKKGHTRK